MKKINLKSKYLNGEHFIQLGTYAYGGTVLTVMTPIGEVGAVASVNMSGYDVPTPPQNQIWTKGWSENEGLPEALQEAGVITLTGERIPAGHCEAELATINEEFLP